MGGLRDRVEEALVGVWREVDDDAGRRGQCPGHFDVEHDLGVGIRARAVAAAVHRYRAELGHGHAQFLEIGLQVVAAVAAAEFDQGDALAAAVGALGEGVQLAQLRRREAGAGLCQRPVQARLRHRPLVQAEHGQHAVLEFVRPLRFAAATAEALAGLRVLEITQFHAEGALQSVRTAMQVNGAAVRLAGGHAEAEACGEIMHGAHILVGGGTGVPRRRLAWRHARGQCRLALRSVPQHHGDLERFLGLAGAEVAHGDGGCGVLGGGTDGHRRLLGIAQQAVDAV